MKLRDILNTKGKYIENIEFDEQSIKEDIEEYQENYKEWDEERVRVQFEDLLRYQYQLMISKYSLGLPVSEIIEDYKQSLYFMYNSLGKKKPKDFMYGKNREPYFSYDEYWKICAMLSLGVLLGVDLDRFNQLVEIREKVNQKDFLLDTLIAYKIKGYNVEKTLMEYNPYKSLTEIILIGQKDNTEAIKILKSYLKNQWYKNNKEMYWYDDHKSKWGVHFGYWSFESGALVKILGLDDSILKDQQYYPYDMVHWNNK